HHPDGLARRAACAGPAAKKGGWGPAYYTTQGNPSAPRQRLELVLKDYVRTLVYPEALWLLAEVNNAEGKPDAAKELLNRLAAEFPYTDFGRRAAQRLSAQR